jgi:hypothetical protein
MAEGTEIMNDGDQDILVIRDEFVGCCKKIKERLGSYAGCKRIILGCDKEQKGIEYDKAGIDAGGMTFLKPEKGDREQNGKDYR